MILKSVIIDDEKSARDTLRSMLQMFCPEVQILGEAEDGDKGIEIIKNKQPDLVFLDVRMPVCNGFEMLEQVGNAEFKLILTTAFTNYSLKAIKYSALDYLLKPIQVQDLIGAVQKAHQNDSKVFDRLSVFKEHFEGGSQGRIVLPHKGGYKVVPYNQILRCQAERNYTFIYFLNGEKLLASKTLKEFEDLLSGFNFFRIHQSHLINMLCVTAYNKGRGGTVELTDGSKLDVARSKKTQFLGALTSGSF